jgi:hypothetical protein
MDLHLAQETMLIKDGIYYTTATDLSPTDNTELDFASNWTAQTLPDYSLARGCIF